ncbi:hypothetical protein HW115_06450 [Verrucomicrobiaceae bacterium N1E253]|uniref:DUF5703 domain-containing protein n=1 Tax=Oceaniferula marina TaxID=2748318 RepID=A0A851GCE2_9BACT|nr:DUF5703 domain-containing protein [Oceaniferula marina]NWK55243.1 hypothetical protein [Oceaniferula marina]
MIKSENPGAKWFLRLAAAFVFQTVALGVDASPEELDRFTVHWQSPSKNDSGTMPIGNGDLAANVWVEPSGDLLFYLSKSDAWSGNGRLLKLGKVRLKLEPGLIAKDAVFSQKLDLATGTIRIQTRGVNIAFWIDAHRPLVHVEVDSEKEHHAAVTFEPWRTKQRVLKGKETHSAYGLLKGPPVTVEPDKVLPSKNHSIRWFHRNQKSCYDVTLKNQHLGHLIEKYPDPLMGRTFGGMIHARGMVQRDDRTLATKNPVKQLHLQIHALTAQTETEQEWLDQLTKRKSEHDAKPLAEARQAHQAWWKQFWNRSWIYISETGAEEKQPNPSSDAYRVTQAYVLQRWINACAGRGKFPIKFNGSLFTVTGKDGGTWDPDYRRWGGCYWWQNTRLPYWSMLSSGDFDMMQPLWQQYTRVLPLLKDRVKAYYKHDGAYFSETMYFWGTFNNANFGWGNPDVHTENKYVRRYWQSGIELTMMMLDYYDHTRDDAFVKQAIIPVGEAVTTFYDEHYKRGEDGKILFDPAQSLETWQKSKNPTPVIVGLKVVIGRLLALDHGLTSVDQRKRWESILNALPEIPTKKQGGKEWILPGETYSHKQNTENTELYAIFPYRYYGLHQKDLDVAKETWRRRQIKRTGGWSQDAIKAGLLGLSKEAKGYIVSNAKRKHSGSRFPAFWGPNFDWIPDQDHGTVTMTAIQRMLLQTDEEEIYLIPAWPEGWNASFKLHAPDNTTVEACVKDGKVTHLKVQPESRKQDVIIKSAQ